MIRTQAVQQNFSRASARYDAHAHLQHAWRRQVMDEARALFIQHACVLDIGCGTGGFASDAPDAWRVHGIDLAWGMCQQAGAIQADAQALPIASNSMDGVVSSLCLQWIDGLAVALQEIHRVLRPGAHAVLMTLGQETLQELRALSSLRLLPMKRLADYVDAAEEARLQVMTAQTTIEFHPYENVQTLLRSFRAIGAQAAFGDKAAPITPSVYSALSKQYRETYPHPEGGIGASWQPLLLILRKIGMF